MLRYFHYYQYGLFTHISIFFRSAAFDVEGTRLVVISFGSHFHNTLATLQLIASIEN